MYAILFGVLSSIFYKLIDFLVHFFSKKVAIGGTALAVFAGLTLTFVTAINSLVQGIYVAFPDSLLVGFGWFIPSNAPACVAAYVSALAARWVFDLRYKIMQITILNI